MLGLISFILVIVGGINWFCIGLLQFDFVAGLFGSQSSIFSRIVYIAIGLGVLVLLFNLIENKGKIKFNFKKHVKEAIGNKSETYYERPRVSESVEAGKDKSLEENSNNEYSPKFNKNNVEAGMDNEYSQNKSAQKEKNNYEELNKVNNSNIESGSDNYNQEDSESTKVESGLDYHDKLGKRLNNGTNQSYENESSRNNKEK